MRQLDLGDIIQISVVSGILLAAGCSAATLARWDADYHTQWPMSAVCEFTTPSEPVTVSQMPSTTEQTKPVEDASKYTATVDKLGSTYEVYLHSPTTGELHVYGMQAYVARDWIWEVKDYRLDKAPIGHYTSISAVLEDAILCVQEDR